MKRKLTFSKNLCMHIVAMKPESMDVNDLDEKIRIMKNLFKKN